MPRDLQTELARVQRALSAQPAVTPPKEGGILRAAWWTGMASGTAVLVAAGATGHPWLMAPGVALIAFPTLFALTRFVLGKLTPQADPLRPRVAVGASLGEGAVVEPGAVVGAGASIGRGAIIRRGAVVRAGVSIGDRAVIEDGAIVSLGASVSEGAVVGANAIVGSGSSVGPNARVPAGMRLSPGSDWKGSATAPPEPVQDPRLQRLEASCARLESELSGSSDAVRAFITTSAGGIGALREAGRGLVRRERALRGEAEIDSLPILDEEQEALRQRASAASDPSVRQSLESAVGAIDEQRRQRKLMANHADRLDAEITRLLWTLDAMGAQMARARTAGAEVKADDRGLSEGVKQLQDEISAIADALDGIAHEERVAMMTAISPITSEEPPASSGTGRERAR